MKEKAWIQIPQELWENRKLALQLAKNDFRKKYAGSYLGTIWAFVQPVVTVFVYWFLFEKGLGKLPRTGGTEPFVLYLISGLVPWFFFQEALNGVTSTLPDYVYLVKKVVFQISVLPFVKVLSSVFVHLFFLAFSLVVFFLYGYRPDAYTLQVIYYSGALFVFVLGLGYLTSAVDVFFRDLSQIVGIVLQIGIWFTPIMWRMETLDIPPVLVPVFKANPLYYIVNGYREALIRKAFFWEHPWQTLYFWGLTLLVFMLGTTVFKRLKVHFADVL